MRWFFWRFSSSLWTAERIGGLIANSGFPLKFPFAHRDIGPMKRRIRLDQILLSLFATEFAAISANTMNNHSMAGDTKSLLCRYFITRGNQRITLKLNQFTALGAVQVIMLGISVIQFVDGATVKLKAIQKTGINEFSERSVNGGRADVVLLATPGQPINQFIRIEVIVFLENRFDQELALVRLPQTAGLKVLLKPLLRRK